MLADVTRAAIATAAHMAGEPGATGSPLLVGGEDVQLAVSPNPSASTTSVSFPLPEPARVDMTVHDVTGRRIFGLVEDFRSAGSHSVRWDGRVTGGNIAPAGVYFVRLSTGETTLVERLTRVR